MLKDVEITDVLTPSSNITSSLRRKSRHYFGGERGAARSREVSSLVAHKREGTSRSMRRSRIMRDKTAGSVN
jgi:hypothetical protein